MLITRHGDLPDPSPYVMGRIYRIPGGEGEADRLVTCLKQDDDSWAWVDLLVPEIDAYTRQEADDTFALIGDSYTKQEADERFAPIGHDHADEDADNPSAWLPGDRLMSIESNINVRVSYPDGSVVGTYQPDEVVCMVDGPAASGGFTWVQVTGRLNGWAAGDFFERIGIQACA